MNYATKIISFRNSAIDFINIILLFQNVFVSKKKAQGTNLFIQI